MRLSLCGSLVIETDDGRLIAPPSPSQRRLLALLAVRSGRVVPTEVICDLLELSPGSLRTTVSRIRKLVGDVLATEPPGYVLRSIDTDVGQFEALVQQAHKAESEEAIELRSKALKLMRGAPLEEFTDEPWARSEALRLRELRLAVAEAHAASLIDARRADEAIANLQPHIEANPYVDSTRGLLMRALASKGRQVDALREYQAYRTLLADEVGAAPGAALQELDRLIASDQLEVSPPAEEPHEAAAADDLSVRAFDGDLAVLIASPCALAEEAQIDYVKGDSLILAAIEAHGGTTFNSDTDALAAVFENAEQAVAAALTAQADCRAEGDDFDLSAAIDIGVMQRSDDRYVGPSVVRSVRLWEAANDGQVVASAAVVTLLPDRSPVVTVEMGAHRLPQISRTVEIYGLHAPGQRWIEGVPRTLRSGRGNLKAPPTTYVPSGDQIERLEAAIDSARLVTVRGPGGIGKTRLVTEVALREISSNESTADQTPRFDHGVWFVQLIDAADSASVATVVAETLGIESPDGTDPADLVVASIGNRTPLLILDNCEHVIDGVRSLVRRLLSECPAITIIATSRESIGLSGEQICVVETLGVHSSVALLTDRARLFGVNLPEREDAALLSELCTKLEGIPLAIELAAARLGSMDAAAILDRLDRRLRLLVGGDPESRHQASLRETVQWSFDLLTLDQQQAFLTLAVFSAGFDLAAACAVLGDSDEELDEFDVLDLLGEFIDKSLVVRESAEGALGRYRILETLREFCVDRLTTDELRSRRDLHAKYFISRVAEVAEIAQGPDWDSALAILDAEWSNIRAAVITTIEADELATAEQLVDPLFYVTWLGGLQEPTTWALRLVPAWVGTRALRGTAGSEDSEADELQGYPSGVIGLAALGLVRARKLKAAGELIDAGLPAFETADMSHRVAIGIMRTMIYGAVGAQAKGHEFSVDFFADIAHDPDCDPRVQGTMACSGALTSMMPIVESKARLVLARRVLSDQPNPATETLISFYEGLVALAEGDFVAMERHSARALELGSDHRVEYLKQQIMIVLTQTPGRSGLDWSVRAAREAHRLYDHSLFVGALEAGALNLFHRGHVEPATKLLGHLGRGASGMDLVSDARDSANAMIATLDGGQQLLDQGATLQRSEVISLLEETVELAMADTTEAKS